MGSSGLLGGSIFGDSGAKDAKKFNKQLLGDIKGLYQSLQDQIGPAFSEYKVGLQDAFDQLQKSTDLGIANIKGSFQDAQFKNAQNFLQNAAQANQAATSSGFFQSSMKNQNIAQAQALQAQANIGIGSGLSEALSGANFQQGQLLAGQQNLIAGVPIQQFASQAGSITTPFANALGGFQGVSQPSDKSGLGAAAALAAQAFAG